MASEARDTSVTPSLLSRAYALLAPIALVLEGVGFALREQLVGGALAAKDPTLALSLFGSGSAVLGLLAITVLVRERKRPMRSLGRGRLMTAGSSGLVHSAGNLALLGLVARADVSRIVASGYALPDELVLVVAMALGVSAAGAVLMLGTAATTFALLSDRARARFFLVFDVALLGALVYVVALFPSRP